MRAEAERWGALERFGVIVAIKLQICKNNAKTVTFVGIRCHGG